MSTPIRDTGTEALLPTSVQDVEEGILHGRRIQRCVNTGKVALITLLWLGSAAGFATSAYFCFHDPAKLNGACGHKDKGLPVPIFAGVAYSILSVAFISCGIRLWRADQ